MGLLSHEAIDSVRLTDDRVGDFTIQQRYRVGNDKCCRLAKRLGQPKMVVCADDGYSFAVVVLGQTPNHSKAFCA